ncbi:MAG: hypothetical protein GXY86_00595 [Firmicutes bacterium]|nr:hypothetical protein [Bacillota bacterium]
MSLTEDYYNEDLIWTPAQRNVDGTTKKDGSGRVLYNTPQTIRGCLTEKIKLIRDKTGKEVVSSGHATLSESVGLDDKINGRLVIAVSAHKDLDGNDEGRTVYMA